MPKKGQRKYPDLWGKSGVYKIICIKTKKFLIGSSQDLSRRRIYHDCVLRKNKHPNPRIQEEYNIYGQEYFDFVVLEFCDIENLKEKEQFWLDSTQAVELGYNLQPNSKDNSGHKYSEKSRNKMKKSQQELGSMPHRRFQMKMIAKEVNSRPEVLEKKRKHLIFMNKNRGKYG